MKIGIICYPTFGGSGVIATELGQSLGQRGHEVHFICYNLPARLTTWANNIYFHMVNVVSYPLFKFPPYTIALASKTAEVIEQYNLDLIHAHYAVPHSTSAHLAQQVVGNKSVKIITTLHGTDIRLVGLDPSYFRVTKYAIENNNGLTAVSRYLARVTKEEFCTKCNIRVIPNFVDTSRFIRQNDPELKKRYAAPEEKLITHVSNFRALKRVTDVVLVFNKIAAKLPAKLLLVGEGPEFARTLELVAKLQLHKQVIFLHQLDNVQDILGISDLLLLPSEMESFGLAALEAMACEVPVVASDVGGLPEVVEHGASGFLAPIGDIEQMSEYALQILENQQLAENFGAMGREIASSKFSEEAIVGQYEDFYREVLAS
jgi:N-acetyl-alpha-D-glucosaminyl L-malate synthase BshA